MCHHGTCHKRTRRWWQVISNDGLCSAIDKTHFSALENKTLSAAPVSSIMVANHRDRSHRREWSAIENTNYVPSLLLHRWEANAKPIERELSFPAKKLSLDQILDNIQEPRTPKYTCEHNICSYPAIVPRRISMYCMYVYTHHICI